MKDAAIIGIGNIRPGKTLGMYEIKVLNKRSPHPSTFI